MTDLLTPAPTPKAMAAVASIPGMAVQPSMLVSQTGTSAPLGPEGAGAVLILQATFTDPERQRGFWDAVVPLDELLDRAPGMIRRYSFIDGPTLSLVALWRSVADARAFAESPDHRAAVRDLYRHRWQYSHFAGLWELVSNHSRIVFCDHCLATAPTAEKACPACGTPFLDPYRGEHGAEDASEPSAG